MKKILIFITLTFLLIGFVSASITGSVANDNVTQNQGVISNNNSENANSDSSQLDNTDAVQAQNSEYQTKVIQRTQNRLQNTNQSNCPEGCTCTGSVTKCQLQDGTREMAIRAGNSGNTIFQVKEQTASTKVELYKEEGKIYGIFNGNKTRAIEVLPDKVQSRLTERIGGLENHEMELDDDGNYQVQAQKRARLFGIIPIKEKVKLQMNSETGEVTKIRNSWWGFLARDKIIVGNRCSTVTPGQNEVCCINKGFNSYNEESGECE